MTDLELTKLCAEAMGYLPKEWSQSIKVPEQLLCDGRLYDPLHDDAQAMALVKKFKLRSICVNDNGSDNWSVSRGFMESAMNPDLNRAIVECVAKMQSTTK